MDYTDSQITVALLKNVERQAKRTAAALERVRDLVVQVRALHPDIQRITGSKSPEARALAETKGAT